jgi:hypothetical protein
LFCSLTQKNLGCLKYRKQPVTDNAKRRVITAVYVCGEIMDKRGYIERSSSFSNLIQLYFKGGGKGISKFEVP